MASGKIKDPNPPTLNAKGFSFKKGDSIDILRIGVLECDECSKGGPMVEHIYFNTMDNNHKSGDKVDFFHADFDTNITQMKLAVNLHTKASKQS